MEHAEEEQWWKQAIIYQIYPRSFQDTNGDGVGDLKGVISRLGYIEKLGVNAIWLCPVFQSPQVDNGYDVSDYYTIDPLFGTMDDAIELINKAHERGLKVIFDLVLNHTSNQHHWFQEALKGRENPYRDYYIWEDPKENGDLPNNWVSVFGGSVWEMEPSGDQYYFHLFKKEMPDLDWDNPKVKNEMLQVARYWLNKGVDGFRLDAFIHMDKLDGFPDGDSNQSGQVSAQKLNEHLVNIENYLQTLLSELRSEKPDLFILGEAASADPDLAVRYSKPENDMCDAIVSFLLFPEDDSMKDPRLPAYVQSSRLDFKAFKETMREWHAKLDPWGGPVLYWNNHDMARAVSRFGDMTEYRDNSSKMLAALMYLQKGIPIIYYGEEIGMKNLHYDDPEVFETPGAKVFYEKALSLGYSKEHILKELNSTGRDVSRGGMQWGDSPFAGFSSIAPWSGVNFEEQYTVQKQEADPDSILAFYRKLIHFKKMPVFSEGDFAILPTQDNLFVYRRQFNEQQALVCCNFSHYEEHFQVKGITGEGWRVQLQNKGNQVEKDSITLVPYGVTVFLKET